MSNTAFLELRNGEYFLENVSLKEIASTLGTPCYVYSRAAIENNFSAFAQAADPFPHQIHYAVKANSNLAVLNILAQKGAGFDIVSEGELVRVLKAGGQPSKIVFSGVGKRKPEIKHAIQNNIGCINIESKPELLEVMAIAKDLNKNVSISIRVNPNIDAKSHPYISTGLKENKFGVNLSDANNLYLEAHKMSNIRIEGIACHIGSQITTLAPFLEVLDKLLAFEQELKKQNIQINHINIGGGLGVRYHNETPPTPEEYIQAILKKITGKKFKLFLEPGRAIIANAGLLLTTVDYLKMSDAGVSFAIVDSGMNDLLRPALYQAWQNIIPVIPRDGETHAFDIVGPVCETSDFLGKNRLLCLKPKDLLAICDTGAYGFSMSSNYNSRPRAAEVMVDGSEFHVIRKRETIEDLFALESILP